MKRPSCSEVQLFPLMQQKWGEKIKTDNLIIGTPHATALILLFIINELVMTQCFA